MAEQNLWQSLWYRVTGRTMLDSILRSDQQIKEWLDFYKGEQDRSYDYVSLSQKKHNRKRRTMNAAKFACSELSRLIWAEQPELVTDKSVEEFLNENNFFDKMKKYSEYGFAGGGFAIKLFAPEDKKLRVDFIAPDFFIPVSWDNSKIIEADFISREIKNGKTYLYLEQHRKAEGGYNIIVTEYLEEGNVLSNKTITSNTFVKTDVPLFAYISTPDANNFNLESPLGMSIYANAIDTLKTLDIIFDALGQEIVLGKSRIIVPATAVRTVFDADSGKPTRYFDPSDEVYQAFNTEKPENDKIVYNTVELRIEEIKLALSTTLAILEAQIGFSAGAFSFDSGTGLKTATEVISENSKTFRLKQTHENTIGKGILTLLEAIRSIGSQYGISTTSTEYNIVWNDSIIEDRNSKTDYWLKRLNSGTCELYEVLMELDGLDENEAKSKADSIKKGSATVDVNSVFGGQA